MNRHDHAVPISTHPVQGQESADIGTIVPVSAPVSERHDSAHLPECPYPLCDDDCFGWSDCHHRCICRALRACEERIKTHEGCADAERAEGCDEGWHAALDAADRGILTLVHRDPTTAVQVGENSGLGMAWSVIDALREGKK